MLNKKAMMAAPSAEPLFIEDTFSCYLYTGNGSTQTITNGIDLAGEGGLVWTKSRNLSGGHALMDTARGAGNQIGSNATDANKYSNDSITAFNNNGYSLGADSSYGNVNIASSYNYVSWTFRKAPKFFDVVTYTGTGANRTVAHNLGSVPGMIIVKRTDTTGNWQVYHRSLANTQYAVLNTTAIAATGTTRWNSTTPTATVFSLGTDATVNASGGTYVAYLFAHDAGGFGEAGDQNVVSCGMITQTGSPVTVTLGWEPQYLLVKRVSGLAGNWVLIDVMQGLPVTGNANYLFADLSSAQTTYDIGTYPTSTGFIAGTAILNGTANNTYIYLAIRRGPMKTPTVGTQVFAPVAYTGNGATQILSTSNVTPDWVLGKARTITFSSIATDRLRGSGVTLFTASTDAEVTNSSLINFSGNKQITVGANSFVNGNTNTYIQYVLGRAPGFFDVVCYTGTGVARTVNHNLGVAPELMIVKNCTNARDWCVYSVTAGATKFGKLNTVDGIVYTNIDRWNNTTPTSTVFSVGTNDDTNATSLKYVAYLFATVPGVSKVGSYTGTGTTQQINCGFTTGARLVLIKRTDSTGSWYIWDSSRGIVAGNDPYLLLNSTAAEVTNTDYVDALASGFEISSTAPAEINASGGSYIYLAIA